METLEFDRRAMERAIELAVVAQIEGERPFGCVIVGPDGSLLSSASGSETPVDPTCHCEIVAIVMATTLRGGLLYGCTLYSTWEPCTLCCGAIVHSKLSRVVYGGCRSDLPQLFRQKKYNSTMLLSDTTHPPIVVPGILRDECVALFHEEVSCLQQREAVR